MNNEGVTFVMCTQIRFIVRPVTGFILAIYYAAQFSLGSPYKVLLCFFLPRCMKCRRGLAMRILSVRPSVRLSVRLSHACIVTKRKKDLSRFSYHTKEHLA